MPNEAAFRRWLVKQKPKNSLIQTIETSTGTGVPDVFYCYEGHPCWIELKDTEGAQCYMRTSQWMWFRKYILAGGIGYLMIRRKDKTIDVYDVKRLLIAASVDNIKGEHMIFKENNEPLFTHKLGTSENIFIELKQRRTL